MVYNPDRRCGFEKRHKRRIRRSNRRYEREGQQTGQDTLFTTITVFSMAAFFVSLARATMKVPQSEFVSSLHLAVLGIMLTFFGGISLWSVHARGRRGSARLLVVTVFLSVAPILWFAGHYFDLGSPEREQLARLDSNPLNLALPQGRPMGAAMEEGDPVLVLTTDRALFGLSRQFPFDMEASPDVSGADSPHVLESPRDLKVAADAVKSSLDVLRQEAPRNRDAWISADRCLPYERFHTYARALQEEDFRGLRLNVVGADHAGVRFTPLLEEESSNELDVEEFAFVFDLSRQGVQMLVDGERIPAVEGCSTDGPTVCVASMSDNCEPAWSSSKLNELVVSAREQRDDTLFLLRVRPDVSLQHVVSLFDAVAYDLNGRTPPDWEERLLVDPLLDLAPNF